MSKKYDLTVTKNLIDHNIIYTSPVLEATKFLIEKLFSTENTIEKQKETAIEIIKKGKENNVDEIEIILEEKAGIDIKAQIQEMGGKITVGQDGKMHIKIKYK